MIETRKNYGSLLKGERYTNVDLKIPQFVPLHVKTIP